MRKKSLDKELKIKYPKNKTCVFCNKQRNEIEMYNENQCIFCYHGKMNLYHKLSK